MDEPTENTANTIEETPKETPKETPSPANDVQVKTEPEDLAHSPNMLTNLEVSIPGVRPNQNLRNVYLSSKKVQNQDDPEPEDLPKEPEELLDGTESTESSDNGQSSGDDENYSDNHESSSDDDESPSDDESELAPDEQRLGDSKDAEPSSRNESDIDTMECSPKPVKIRHSNKSKGKKKTKPSISSKLNEKVRSLMQSNILSDANANAADMKQSIPVSQKGDKAKALAEEVAKLPIGDQAQAKKDAAALIEDSKKFTPSAKIVNMNWKVEGLETLLKHHQVRNPSSIKLKL